MQPRAVVLVRTPYGRLLGSAGWWAAQTVLMSGWLEREALEPAEVADGIRVSWCVGEASVQNEPGARLKRVVGAQVPLTAFHSIEIKVMKVASMPFAEHHNSKV